MASKFDRYMVVVGAGRHAKFARLTDAERCAHFLGVLSIAARAPIRGYLLVGEKEADAVEVAFEAAVSVRIARQAIEKLKSVGVLKLDEKLGAWYVHDWSDVNPEPKKDERNAERQATHRARRAAARNASRNGKVTAENVARNAPRNGTEVEVEVGSRRTPDLLPSFHPSIGEALA